MASAVSRQSCHGSHIAHVRIADFTHASGMILFAMAIEHVELHVEFQDRLQTLIDRAREQDGNLHDRWKQNGDACIHPGSDSGKPFDAHLRIHYHLQLLSHPRLQLISTTEN